MPLGIEVRLLGPMSLLIDGSEVAVPGARQRVALASMALASGGTASSEVLADHIWGDDPPARMRPALHTTITRLRKLVGTDRVVSTAGGYTLAVPDGAVDVQRFRSLLAAARGAEDPAEETRLLEQARRLWRGDPLDGVDSERLRAEHVYPLTEEWFASTERLVDLRLVAGDHGDLAGDLHALISRHPLRESLWSRLMRALAASGRQAEALGAYQEIRRQLLEQLGVDPGQELVAAHAAVLAGTPTPSLGAENGALPAAAPAPTPRQLPTDLATFIGRVDELTMLDDLAGAWDDDSARRTATAVVDGAGGMGKTALAVHWGHRTMDRFPDGQLYVNLRGYGPGAPVDPSAAAGAMLGALSVPDEQIPPDPDARSALLRTTLADRRVLMVLDNARDADQVRPLLPGSSAFVLVTSRSQLRGLVSSVGAHRITLSGLSDSEAASLLERADRQPQMAGESTVAQEVASLCARVPLALAVAAERLTRTPDGRVDVMLSELRDQHSRLDVLSAGDDERTDVRAVLSWSYQAVHDDEALLFRLLPLAPGPDITAAAAAALLGRSEAKTRRLLDRLVDAHLLLEKGAGRFELHDLIRVYAAELGAGAEERGAARRRVRSWYCRTAINARGQLLANLPLSLDGKDAGIQPLEFENPTTAVAWFDGEHQNLAEIVWDTAGPRVDDLAWRVAAALGSYFTFQRPWDHSVTLLERGLACAQRSNDGYGEAVMLAALGDCLHFAEDHEESLALSRRALAAFREIGNPEGEAGMLTNIGMTLVMAGRSDEAIESLRLAVTAFEASEASEDPGMLALALGNLAAAYNSAGRHDAAIDTATRALRLSRAAGNPLSEANVMDELGSAHAGKGEHRAAMEYYADAIDRYHADEHPYEILVMDHLAHAHRAAGDARLARETWERALALATDLEHPFAAQIRAELAADP